MNSEAPADTSSSHYFPELIFCLCAASGTDTAEVIDALRAEMESLKYEVHEIRLSKLMSGLKGFEYLKSIEEEDLRIQESIAAGNQIRKILSAGDAVARLSLIDIHSVRMDRNNGDATQAAERCCFIINSLKRTEEIDLLRHLFGQRVFLISIYEPKAARIGNLSRKIAKSRKSADSALHHDTAAKIIAIDQKESGVKFGQRLEDVFQMGDVFLKAGMTIRAEVRRFVQLLFGAPFLTPTTDEYLMLHAYATAHRTADLSRQVGAVIATTRGEILATGCNEVPRAGGGVVWDDVVGTDKDYRDYKLGSDAAVAAKKEDVAEALHALQKAGWLKRELSDKSPDDLALAALFSKTAPLEGTRISSLLEFGRIVHAEMAAICDAAMRGVSVREATLFCTTFPCHMCARHIIAAGISRVVYIQPYPKSRAKKLYRKTIRVDADRDADIGAVEFEAFVGVAPRRFFDLFGIVERKDVHGYAVAETAASDRPKCVTLASYVSPEESDYLRPLTFENWKPPKD